MRLFVYLLAAAVGFIAATTEYLNASAGYVMPRPEPVVTKWRVSAATSEAMWRRIKGPRDEEGRPVARQLTPDERNRMRAEIAEERANDRLRRWVSSAGLLQYLLIPAFAAAIVAALVTHQDRAGVLSLAPAAVVLALAAASLYYRGYFTSLGW